MYVGTARSKNESDEAVNLAARIFRPENGVENSSSIKSMLVSLDGCILGECVVIVKLKGEVIATCFIVERLFFLSGEEVKGSFISSVCVAESFRGKGYASKLLNFALGECDKKGSKFAIVIARKAVDHFYNKFSFWGISGYSKINISIPPPPKRTMNLDIRQPDFLDAEELNTIYKNVYAHMPGSCVRSRENWEYLLWKISFIGCKISLLMDGNTLAGYIIYSAEQVYEFALIDDLSYLDFLTLLGQKLSLSNITLHASEFHPAYRNIGSIEHSVTHRQCIYGGHMVRILNFNFLYDLILKNIKRNLHKLRVNNYYVESNCLKIISGQEGIKLILDEIDLGYENTGLLMQATISSSDYVANSILGSMPFNIPLIDQI
jgi:predicted acetyltransferase